MLKGFEERMLNDLFGKKYKFGVINYKDDAEHKKGILKVEDDLFIIDQKGAEDYIDLETAIDIIKKIENRTYQYLGSGFLNFVPKYKIKKHKIKGGIKNE